MAYYDDDRRGRHRGSYSYNLNVNDRSGRGRSRSRSSPNRMPDINIYNDVYADNDLRAQQTPQDNRGRPVYAQQIPVMMPQQMPMGSMGAMGSMGMPMPGQYPSYGLPRPSHSRSSSSRSSHSTHRHNSDAYELEKMRAERAREAAIAEFKRSQEREEEEKHLAIKHAELEREEHEKESKKAAEQAILDFRNKEKARQAEEQRVAEEYERKKKEKAAEEKAAAEEYIRKKKEKADEEKAAAEEYMRKKKEQEKKDEEDQKEATRKTLAKAGMTEAQIEGILNPKDNDKRGRTLSTTQLVVRPGNSINPIYPKIRRQDIAPETLKHYKLPWMYDETDSEYLIIMQEMSVRETDILFKHTAKVRERGSGGYMIEADRKNLMVVRRRSKSRGKSPARPENVVGKLFFK